MSQPAVPFLALGPQVDELRGEIDAAVARVLSSGWYLLGKELEAFESAWAGFCEAKHAIGLANGLDAIRLALEAVGVKPGDEVLVPSHTYIASWLGVMQCGAKPVPVECDPATANLDPARLAAALTPRTRAVLPVHLYGLPVDMEAVTVFARAKGLLVVEDAAQCHGARCRGRRIGSHGDAVAWSFYPTKNLGALGDSGAVTTDRPEVADRLRVLRNYGQRERYVCETVGLNSRMEELHAAVLRVKLAHLEAWNARRARQVARYLRELAGLRDLALPPVPAWAEPAWHLFVVRYPRRDQLRAALAAQGIQAIVHYPVACHRQQAMAGLGIPAGALPIAERLAAEVLSLPLGPHLTDDQQGLVIAAVRAAC